MANSRPVPEVQHVPTYAPYSLPAMGRMMVNNAGLIFVGLSILIVGFIAGSLWTENQLLKKGLGGSQAAANNGATAQAAQPTPNPILSDADWQTVLQNPAGTIGQANAKVTMVEFTDYQCPFCGQYFTNTYGQLKSTYVDPGKVRMILHDLPLTIHPNARIAALAARCATDMGGAKAWQSMHDTLFSKQSEWVNLGKDDAIKKYGDYAQAIGLNSAKMQDCVKTEKFAKLVDDDTALATKLGANGTPTFFIQKQMLVGALPLDSFKSTIDQALSQ